MSFTINISVLTLQGDDSLLPAPDRLDFIEKKICPALLLSALPDEVPELLPVPDQAAARQIRIQVNDALLRNPALCEMAVKEGEDG